MEILEREFLRDFENENEKESMKKLEELLNRMQEKNVRIRVIKNYLIWLNALMFERVYLKPSCKKRLFIIKDDFLKVIEEKMTLEELHSLGKNMVKSYLNHIGRKCRIINPIVNSAIIYIDNNLEEEISLEGIAEMLNVSSSYLSSLFNESINMSFSKFLNMRRIEKSKILLEVTSDSLLDIAFDCGFRSQSYFCYVFKKFVSMTPKEYRAKKTYAII